MRALIAQLRQEGNSFNPITTTLADFSVRRGDSLLGADRDRGSVLGGIINQLRRDRIEIIPTIAASARPGGPVRSDLYESFVKEILVTTANELPELIVLDLHGSMLTEDSDDPEGDLLVRLRKIVGANSIIAIGLDLHANVTEKMLVNANIVTACKHNPHSDYFETGVTASKLAVQIARGSIKPTTVVARLSMLLQGNTETGQGPLLDVHAAARAWLRDIPGALDLSIFNVQPTLDVPDMAQVVIAITDGSQHAAETICQQIAGEMWERRSEFINHFPSIDNALQLISNEPEQRPFVVSDYGDRVLGGATGDSVEILKNLTNSPHTLRAAVPVVDPEAVEAAAAAGVGQKVSLRIGGAINPLFGGLNIEGEVLALTDGQYTLQGPFLAGQKTCHGSTAVIATENSVVIATERPGYSQDVMFFKSAGLDIESFDFVVVKSGNHFQLSFDGIATPLKVDSIGIGAYKPGLFDVSRAPLYPEIDSEHAPISVKTYQ